MEFPFNPGVVLGTIASALTLISFSMKSMLPLRMFALASNFFFIAYGYLDSLLPVLILHACLLPLNIKRLLEIRKLTAEIRKATEASPVSQWLLPHMTRRTFKAGEVLFRKGDAADSMTYVAVGELRMDGTSETLGPGALIGEIGLFSPDRKRTQTLTCHTDCELYSMTGEMMYRLYYQNPSLGFYFMHLVVSRLQRDVFRERHPQAAG
jgi:CRP/FNR family transcriptional regulator, cyclic AMP receptor protein